MVFGLKLLTLTQNKYFVDYGAIAMSWHKRTGKPEPVPESSFAV